MFTCGVIRPIHLLLMQKLITESCLTTVRRFIVQTIVLDIIGYNKAKTFKRT